MSCSHHETVVPVSNGNKDVQLTPFNKRDLRRTNQIHRLHLTRCQQRICPMKHHRWPEISQKGKKKDFTMSFSIWVTAYDKIFQIIKEVTQIVRR